MTFKITDNQYGWLS